jgi:hypothetical protein
VKKVIDECEELDDPALAKVLALLWRFAAEAAKAEAASFAHEAAARATGGRLPLLLEFSPANDGAGLTPMLTADPGLHPAGVAPLELAAPAANSGDDKAPRVELPPKLVARLEDAA